jgi:hypothetical protein
MSIISFRARNTQFLFLTPFGFKAVGEAAVTVNGVTAAFTVPIQGVVSLNTPLTVDSDLVITSLIDNVNDGDIGVRTLNIPTNTASGTALTILPGTYTYTLVDSAGSKVSLSGATVSLAAAASSTASTYQFKLQATPVNGGEVIDWVVRVNVTVPTPVVQPGLGYTPVIIILGDSNGIGNAGVDDAAAAAAAYPANARIKVLKNDETFGQYVPNVLTGAMANNSSTDVGAIGAELGFINSFTAVYPNEDLYVFKRAQGGTYQATVQPSAGSFTGSISGNVLTVTAGTATGSRLLVGAGIPPGIVITSGSAPTFFLRKLGTSTLPNLTVASTTITMYPTGGWSSDNGSLWNGNATNPDTYGRYRIQRGLAAMTAAGLNPKVVAVYVSLGGNDADYTFSANAFGAEQLAFVARLRADLPLTNVPIIYRRTPIAGSPYATTVRASFLANINADPLLFGIDADGYTKDDGVHDNIAGLKASGAIVYNIAFNGATGME